MNTFQSICLAVHADLDAMVPEDCGEGIGGKLTP